jgi:arabinose-5-phosphate isomerase
MNINIIKRAKEVLEIESCAVAALASRIDENFVRAVSLIAQSKGRVVVSGMGRPVS